MLKIGEHVPYAFASHANPQLTTALPFHNTRALKILQNVKVLRHKRLNVTIRFK